MVAPDATGGIIVTRVRLLALLAAALFGLGATGSAIAEDEGEDFSWNTNPDVRVEIEIVSGQIEIEGWDRNEVLVQLEGDDARRLDIEAGRKKVSIRSPGLGRRRFPWASGGLDVDVSIFVPVGSRIKAKSLNGPIQAEGVGGILNFYSANGDIKVKGSPSEARLETINASIELEGLASRVDARTVNGSIKLTGVSTEVSASTISGSIEVDAGTLERADLKTLSGSIELATRFADRARANLKSFSGSIRLDLPSDTSARFDIQSFSGGILNELRTSSTHSGPRVGGQHLEFTTAEGDGRVEIESFSGGVEIRVDD
jgi:DUF4097 and DUF4098 domain-containing protein YvlB